MDARKMIKGIKEALAAMDAAGEGGVAALIRHEVACYEQNLEGGGLSDVELERLAQIEADLSPWVQTRGAVSTVHPVRARGRRENGERLQRIFWTRNDLFASLSQLADHEDEGWEVPAWLNREIREKRALLDSLSLWPGEWRWVEWGPDRGFYRI